MRSAWETELTMGAGLTPRVEVVRQERRAIAAWLGRRAADLGDQGHYKRASALKDAADALVALGDREVPRG